jgi:hypothetical protein
MPAGQAEDISEAFFSFRIVAEGAEAAALSLAIRDAQRSPKKGGFGLEGSLERSLVPGRSDSARRGQLPADNDRPQ